MHVGMNLAAKAAFNLSTSSKLISLYMKLARRREHQYLGWYSKLLENDSLIGSSIADLYPQVRSLADKEKRFVVSPDISENGNLEKEWIELHEKILDDLRGTRSDLCWGGLETQLDEIAQIAWSHRATWTRQRQLAANSLKVCRKFLDCGEIDEAYALRKNFLAMLEGTSKTMLEDSRLAEPLSPG